MCNLFIGIYTGYNIVIAVSSLRRTLRVFAQPYWRRATGHMSPRLPAEVTNTPRALSRVHDEWAAIAVDGHLSLFGNQLSQFLLTFAFDNSVEFMEFSDDGLFLVVVERPGKLHFIDVPLQTILYTHVLVTDVIKITFAQTNVSGVCDLFVLSPTGVVHQFSNLCTTRLHNALCDGDVEAVVQCKGQLRVTVLTGNSVQLPDCLTTFVHSSGDVRFITAGGGHDPDEEVDVMCLWKLDPLPTTSEDSGEVSVLQMRVYDRMQTISGAGVIKCAMAGDVMMVTLDTDHCLSYWDMRIPMLMSRWTQAQYKDFILVDGGDAKQSAAGMKFVGLTLGGAGVPSQLHVRTLLGMELVYALEMAPDTCLAESSSFQEELYVLEGCRHTPGPDDHALPADQFRFRSIVEVEPKQRLYRLLQRNKYGRAEEFAKEYQLDLQSVYVSKANHLLACVCSTRAGMESELDDLVRQLFTTLKLVQDIGVMLDQCTRAALPTYAYTHQLLTYLLARVKESSFPSDDPRIDTLHAMIYRLHTFRSALGEDHYSADIWERFLDCDVISTVEKFLVQDQLKAAFVIWNRHITNTAANISEEAVTSLLRSVPCGTRAVALHGWLSDDLVPTLARQCPGALPALAEWLETIALSLETSEPEGWPSNALTLTRILPSALTRVSREAGDQSCVLPAEFSNQCLQSDSSCRAFIQLNCTISNLTRLHELYTVYHCTITMQDFLSETVESLAVRLLDQARTASAVRTVVHNNLQLYIAQYKLSQNRILYLHLASFLRKVNSDESVRWWEAVAVALIDEMTDVAYRCRAVVLVMKKAYMPWSSTVQALVDHALSLRHDLVNLVHEQNRFAILRRLLFDYGLQEIPPEQLDTTNLVRFILKADRADCVKDALTVVGSVEKLNVTLVYDFRLRFLISQNRLSECLWLYRSLPRDLALECGEKMVIGTKVMLECKLADHQDVKLARIRMTEAAVSVISLIIPLITDDWMLTKQMTDDATTLAAISALQIEYGVFMAPSAYHKPEARAAIMYAYLERHYTGQTLLDHVDTDELRSERKTAASSSAPNSGQPFTLVYRLADLLLISRDVLLARLATQAAKTGSVPAAVRFTKELCECTVNASNSRIIYDVVFTLHGLIGDGTMTDTSLLPVLLGLASQVVTYCHPDMMADSLELYKCVSLTARACKLHRDGTDGTDGTSTRDTGHNARNVGERFDGFSMDPYTNWCYSPCYEEEALVSYGSDAGRLMGRLQGVFLAPPNERRYNYVQDRTAGKSRLVLQPGVSVLEGLPMPKPEPRDLDTKPEATLSRDTDTKPDLNITHDSDAKPNVRSSRVARGAQPQIQVKAPPLSARPGMTAVAKSSRIKKITNSGRTTPPIQAVPSNLVTHKPAVLPNEAVPLNLVTSKPAVPPTPIPAPGEVLLTSCQPSDTSVSTLSPSIGEVVDDEPQEVVQSRVAEIRRISDECIRHLVDSNQLTLAAEVGVLAFSLATQHLAVHRQGFHQNKMLRHVLSVEESELSEWRHHWLLQHHSVIYALIKKILTHPFIDQALLLTYLDALPPHKCQDIITKCVTNLGTSYKKLMDLSEVGIVYSRLVDDVTSRDTLEDLRLKAFWGHKLSKYKISFKSAYLGLPGAKEQVALQLVRSATSDVIRQYFTTFKIDSKRIFPDVLESLLLTSEPGADGDVTATTSFAHAQRVQLLISNITDNDVLTERLWSVIEKLSVYDYARISFVLAELAAICPGHKVDKGLRLITFLSTYKRVSPPGDYEKALIEENRTEEDQLLCGSGVLPVSSCYRLPFHALFTGQPLKVLSKELMFSTVHEWAVLSADLKLTTDHLYILTIQNCISARLAANQQADTASTNQGAVVSTNQRTAADRNVWSRTNIDSEFYDQVYSLMNMMSAREQAVMCASWIVKELPAGAEKVHALSLCVRMSELWYEACADDSPEKDKARKTNAKFISIHKRVSTEQILNENDMGDAELLSLLNNPCKLIFQLYEHPSILDRFHNRNGVYPDIHAMTSEIATNNRLDIDEIRLHLTHQWLLDQSAGQDVDLSLTFNFKLDGGAEEAEPERDDSSLQRLLYLLNTGDIKQALRFLINTAFVDVTASTSVTSGAQLRALHCALALADTALIEQTSGKTATEIRQRMHTIRYIIELDKLMIKKTVGEFEATNKGIIARSVWKHHSRDKRAVMLVSVLCLDYRIYDVEFWSSIIRQLVLLDQVDHLEVVLLRLCGAVGLYRIQGLDKAWQLVITSQLSNLTRPFTDHHTTRLLRPIYLYMKCPVQHSLDLEELVRLYRKLEVAPCAIYFTLQSPNRDLTVLLEGVDYGKLLDEVAALTMDRVQPDAEGVVLQAIYKYIRTHRLYSRLLSSQHHFRAFVHYLIVHDDVTDLLVSTIKSNRRVEAEKLVCLYNKTNGNSGQLMTSPRHQLKTYLERRSLSVTMLESIYDD